jgi:hypothetical protein
MIAFAPHRLREGGTRQLADVEAVTFMVLDVDRVADVDALAQRVREYAPAMIYASPSDTPEARRVRVIAPVSREITVDECSATRLAFAKMLSLEPGCGVEGALDASKLFFVGRLHGTPKRQIWRFDR